MAQAPTPPKPSAPVTQLSPEAQAIVDQLEVTQRVFVSKDDLAEDDEEDLKAAGYGVDQDVVRDGFFVRRLSDTEKAEVEVAKSEAASTSQATTTTSSPTSSSITA